MKSKKHTSVVRLTSLALLAALVVVLQTVATGIKIGPVPISLTLVPIVVGAILFGQGAGAFLNVRAQFPPLPTLSVSPLNVGAETSRTKNTRPISASTGTGRVSFFVGLLLDQNSWKPFGFCWD